MNTPHSAKCGVNWLFFRFYGWGNWGGIVLKSLSPTEIPQTSEKVEIRDEISFYYLSNQDIAENNTLCSKKPDEPPSGVIGSDRITVFPSISKDSKTWVMQ